MRNSDYSLPVSIFNAHILYTFFSPLQKEHIAKYESTINNSCALIMRLLIISVKFSSDAKCYA